MIENLKKNLKKHKNTIGLAVFLGLLVLAFNVATNIFVLNNSRSKTFVLDRRLFEDSRNNELKTLKVEGVDLIEIGRNIWDLKDIDNATIIYSTDVISSKENRQVMQIVDFNHKDTMVQLEITNAYGYVVSNDGKRVMYVVIEQDSKAETTYILSLEDNSIIAIFEGRGLVFLPGDEEIVLIKEGYLYRQDLISGSIQRLAELSKEATDFIILDKIEALNGYYIVDYKEKVTYKRFSPVELQAVVRGNKLYFMGADLEGMAIFSLDLEVENSLEVLVKGAIFEFDILSSRRILFRGRVNEVEGIYLYDTEKKSYQLVIKGTVLQYAIASDGRLAYVLQNDRGNYELHIAYYDGDEIIADEIIYKDNSYAIYLSWSRGENKLFYGNRSVKGSQIYRFNFGR